jgi:fermentation-respiration switch protein FrsA (DUF1100 family)
MFLAAGYSVLMPDSRGHGRSGGEFVTYGWLERYDAIGWARWLRSQGCHRVYGLGESLGAAVLIQASDVEPQFDAIVAECAFSDLRSIAEKRTREMSHLPEWLAAPAAKLVVASAIVYARARYGIDFRQVSPRTSLSQSTTPVLLIHGLRDSRTPYWHSQVLAAANPRAELWLVPGAEHTSASTVAPDEFHRRVLAWFAGH